MMSPRTLDQAEIKLLGAHLKVRLGGQVPRCAREEPEARRETLPAPGFRQCRSPPASPEVWRTWDPRAQPTHLLQSLFFFPSQLQVPLNHFPDVLGLFIRELGKVQFFPHLGGWSGSHLENHRIMASAQEARDAG